MRRSNQVVNFFAVSVSLTLSHTCMHARRLYTFL